MTPVHSPAQAPRRAAATASIVQRLPRRRSPRSLRRLGRTVLTSYYRRAVDRLAADAKHPRWKAFSPLHVGRWLWDYLRYVFTPRFPFQNYDYAGKNGVYRVRAAAGRDELKIALASDWATGTPDAQAIATLIARENADFTIHLGGVHFVGDFDEIDRNFFGVSQASGDGVAWPAGRQGTFALNGNREMFANGEPYYTRLLKRIGLRGDREGQVASFFCLETGHWRVLAVDTGYNSVGLPVLGLIPGLRRIPRVGGDATLMRSLLEWLREDVRPQERPMATVILSHQPCLTAFGGARYPKPARQLAEFFKGQELVWLWGHEHRLGIYAKTELPGGMVVHGRCVGHGGMPIELVPPDANAAPLWLYDRDRNHTLSDGRLAGENGFVVLTFDGAELTFDYRDVSNLTVFAETFVPAADGTLEHTFSDPGILQSPA